MKWPGATSWSGGSLALHFSVQYLQRGPNLQPTGSYSGLGTAPGMASSRLSLGVFSRGIEIIKPSV